MKLSEHFTASMGLRGKEEAEYWLIVRYWAKVSPRLKDRRAELLLIAQENFNQMMREELGRPNRLLKQLQKDHVWQGSVMVWPCET